MKRYLLIILLAGIFFAGSCCQRAPVNRISEMRDSLVVEYMSYAGLFYDSSFLDWDAFVNLGLNQNKSDWGVDVERKIHPSWRGHEAASLYWDRLQSAKICLHCKSLPLRAVSDERMLGELDYMEEAFDEAFIEMVSQEYYLRVFQDVFDEIFAPRIDRLSENLKISKK